MDIQQAINLRILQEFSARGIAFAYPTSVSINRSEKEPPAGYHAINVGTNAPEETTTPHADKPAG
jgi:hypothetical protein